MERPIRSREMAKDAVLEGDLAALGDAMSRNTERQRLLHPSLLSEKADEILTVGRDFGILGFKVNGAARTSVVKRSALTRQVIQTHFMHAARPVSCRDGFDSGWRYVAFCVERAHPPPCRPHQRPRARRSG